MTRVLFNAETPETADFSDPALPPGFDAAKITAGDAVASIEHRGWQGDTFMIPPDDSAAPLIERRLASAQYDCVMIGAGPATAREKPRIAQQSVNAVHRAAPGARIAFNTLPEDAADAAARQLLRTP